MKVLKKKKMKEIIIKDGVLIGEKQIFLIYILIEKDKEMKKEKLIEEIIDYFNIKHELINHVFLSEK